MPDIPRNVSRRTATKRGGGSVTVRDRSAAFRRLCTAILDADPLCRYCHANGHVTAAKLVDHIIALALGGRNDRCNLAPACVSCNAAKAKVEQRCAARGYGEREALLDYDLSRWIRLARAFDVRS